jgi:hypothetical protein
MIEHNAAQENTMFPKAKLPFPSSEIDPFDRDVLKLADGTRSAAIIAQDLSVPVYKVESSFDSLRDEGLLEGWTAPPAALSTISRRRALADLGRAAALFGSAAGALSLAGSSKAFAGSAQEQTNKERKSKK